MRIAICHLRPNDRGSLRGCLGTVLTAGIIHAQASAVVFEKLVELIG